MQGMVNKLLIILLLVFLISCKEHEMSKEQSLYSIIQKGFEKETVSIFKSELGELDTIILSKAYSNEKSTKNLSQGFFETKVISVDYNFSQGSYHRKNNSKPLLNYIEYSFDSNIFEVSFLDCDILNPKFLKQLKPIEVINSKKDSTLNGINEFSIDLEYGILRYTDSRGKEWSLVK